MVIWRIKRPITLITLFIRKKKNIKEGFIVKGKDTITFLKEKLAQLGLNEREANEFIIYSLPIHRRTKLKNYPSTKHDYSSYDGV